MGFLFESISLSRVIGPFLSLQMIKDIKEDLMLHETRNTSAINFLDRNFSFLFFFSKKTCLFK